MVIEERGGKWRLGEMQFKFEKIGLLSFSIFDFL